MNSTEKEITLKPQDLKNDDFRNYGLRFSKKEIEYEEKVLLFQVTGIAVLLVFYGCYFIKMTAQSRKGIKTDQTELVTNGIYRFSRNPAFLGFDLVYIGILLMFFSLDFIGGFCLCGSDAASADRICGRRVFEGSIWGGIFRVPEKGLPISGQEMMV